MTAAIFIKKKVWYINYGWCCITKTNYKSVILKIFYWFYKCNSTTFPIQLKTEDLLKSVIIKAGKFVLSSICDNKGIYDYIQHIPQSTV